MLILWNLNARAAVGLSITPSAITNNFVGKLTLLITNLTVGQTVMVLTYVDLNGNGVVDPGEPIASGFTVTDGQAPTIGGVRNLNVPRDEDGATNGQIRAELFVPDVSGTLANAGRYVVQVVNPVGNAVLGSLPFTITASTLPQGVTGHVTDAGSGLPLSNSVVGVQGLKATSAIFTMADSNGSFTCYTLPDTYAVFAADNGYINPVTNLVSVNCGQFAAANFAFAKGQSTIQGKVTDSATGLGLAGVGILARSTNASELDVFSFTDVDGDYSLVVSGTNRWDVRTDKGATVLRGCVPLNSRTKVPITSGTVSNVNFVLSNATALIYGNVLDDHHNPVTGLQLSADDLAGVYDARSGSVVTNGNYSIAVLPGTNWFVSFNQQDLAARGYLTPPVVPVAVTAGQATNVNFVLTHTNLPSLSALGFLPGNRFQLSLAGPAGQNYTILTATNLGTPNWIVVLNTNAPCDPVIIVDPQATNRSQYYRAMVAP